MKESWSARYSRSCTIILYPSGLASLVSLRPQGHGQDQAVRPLRLHARDEMVAQDLVKAAARLAGLRLPRRHLRRAGMEAHAAVGLLLRASGQRVLPVLGGWGVHPLAHLAAADGDAPVRTAIAGVLLAEAPLLIVHGLLHLTN